MYWINLLAILQRELLVPLRYRALEVIPSHWLFTVLSSTIERADATGEMSHFTVSPAAENTMLITCDLGSKADKRNILLLTSTALQQHH
jgi:hypothetical protein